MKYQRTGDPSNSFLFTGRGPMTQKFDGPHFGLLDLWLLIPPSSPQPSWLTPGGSSISGGRGFLVATLKQMIGQNA
jgi:hypothetical protein